MPRTELAPGERVVLDLHPHGRCLVRPLLLVPVVAGLTAFVVTVVRPWSVAGVPVQGWLRLLVAAVALLALVRWSVAPALRWRSRRYVLTTSRVLVRDGIVRRSGRDLPLDRVADVSFSARGTQRLFRSGTLWVETGGEHGRLRFDDVPRVASVQRAVQAQAVRGARMP